MLEDDLEWNWTSYMIACVKVRIKFTWKKGPSIINRWLTINYLWKIMFTNNELIVRLYVKVEIFADIKLCFLSNSTSFLCKIQFNLQMLDLLKDAQNAQIDENALGHGHFNRAFCPWMKTGHFFFLIVFALRKKMKIMEKSIFIITSTFSMIRFQWVHWIFVH